uniref:Putative monocarboxylate transporter n=1 Tax=Anopheles triannulatus TaxID=58253 RepID=A0A2M4AGP0_9DIPT
MQEQRASNTRGGNGGGGGGSGPQLRQPPMQCSSTDSGNSSSVSSSSSSSNGAGGAVGTGGSNSVSASGVSVDDPETKNPPTDPIGDQAAIKRNVYVNKTYDGEARAGGGDVACSLDHSIDEGIDHEEEQKQQSDASAVDLEQHQEVEEIKPLLEIAHERLPKRTKSIVKSPSNQSFGEKAPRTLSLQFSQPESVIVADRPVHHVQFSSKQRTESDSDGCERATLLAGGMVSGALPMDPMCPASPVGSILSHGSGSSSESGSSSSSSSNGNSSLEAYAEARPPDGGWGWVVCFASFMVNLIADGVTFSFGVMYIELLSYFGEGKGKTAWVGSLFMAMPLLCGPVASFLTDRYGCRKVTIIGSILASVGFALSAYATSIEMLYLTFGILAGFGLSLCYVAAVVIVAYYFDKKRSFATGLSVCGSGIGTFIFASLTQVLLDEYGWRGTTLILAGVFLNMCLCGLLMRDLEWTTHKSKQRRRKQQQQQQQADSVSNSTNTAGNASVIEPGGGGGVGLVGGTGVTMAEAMNEQYDLDDPRLFSSLITLPTFLQNGGSHEKIPLELLTMLSKQRNVHDHHLLQSLPPKVSSSHSFSQPLSPQSGDDLAVHNEEQAEGDADNEDQDQQKGEEGTDATAGSTKPANGSTINEGTDRASRQRAAGGQRTGARGRNVVGQKQSAAAQYEHEQAQLPVFLRRVHSHSTRGTAPAIGATSVAPPQGTTASYLKDLRMHRHSLTYRGAMLNIQRYRLRASSCPDIYRNSMTTIAKEKSAWFQGVEEFRTLLVSILDFSYFSDVHYLLFAVSNFLLYTFYDVPYVYLGDYATQLGFSSQSSSMLISIIGILNMVGEVVLGWMGDRKSVNANYTYAICMGLCGVVTALVPLFKDLTSLSALAGGFGLFIAANYSLTSIILVELISLERFTNAYGLLLLVQGVANLVGPPLAGWISDLTESYDLSFYLAGFFIVISGALLMVLPVLTKVRKTMEAQRRRSSARTTTDIDSEGAHLDKKHCNNNISSKPVTLDLKSTFIANGKGTTPNGISKGVSYAEHVVGVDSKNQPFKGGVTV